jgi:hypothetical protein
MRKRGSFAAAMATAATLAIAGTAQAAVTIGSTLATPFAANDPGCNAGVPCTATNLALPAANQAAGGLFSPVNGTITSWKAAANTGVDVSLQVIRPVSGTTYTGVATSAPASWATGVSPDFATSLPIQAGDGIGLLNRNQNLIYGNNPGATIAAWYLAPAGFLADGSTRAADVTGAREALVQATIEPSNKIKFGAVTRNKKKGTATVKVELPNAGKLDYSGDGLAISGPATVVGADTVEVTVRATGKKQRKLRRKGKAGASPKVTFTPTNGTAASDTQSLQLKKKLKKK